MAELKAVNYTNETAVPMVRTSSALRSGKLRVHYDTIELAAASIADTANFGTLPAGAVVWGVEMWADDQGTSVTFDLTIGAELIFDDIDVATAASYTTTGAAAYIGDVAYTVGTTAETVFVTVAGGAATGTVTVKVIYSLKN